MQPSFFNSDAFTGTNYFVINTMPSMSMREKKQDLTFFFHQAVKGVTAPMRVEALVLHQNSAMKVLDDAVKIRFVQFNFTITCS